MTTTAPSGRRPQAPFGSGAPGAAGRSGAHPAPSAAEPPLTAETARRLGRTPGSRFNPDRGSATMGAPAAAKAVAEDLQRLVRAEIAYAKAEVTDAAKAKGMGIGLLVAAGVVAWLAVQGLLITIGFALAAAGLPGWAAAGIVTLVLLLVVAVAALVAKRKLSKPLSLEPTKERVEEDVTWIKSHLPSR